MATVQLSVTKSTDFQGQQDEFSNVYRFTGVDGAAASLQALANKVVELEKAIFAGVVNFKRVRVWSDDPLTANVMLLTQDLTGTGSAAAAAMYRECAIMMRFPLPPRTVATSDLNNPFKRVSRYLRKYLHTCSAHGYDITGSGSPTTVPDPSPLRTYAAGILEPVAGAKLCAPNGDLPTAGPTFPRYMEHRQFPRGRKE